MGGILWHVGSDPLKTHDNGDDEFVVVLLERVEGVHQRDEDLEEKKLVVDTI